MSALHEAAACGDVDRLEDLLAQSRINKNEKDEDWDGRTPLFWAAIEGHLTCVKLLLEAGANPTSRNNDDKTVAHYVAESGRFDILRAVLEYGCDVTIADKYGDTAMDYALLYGNLECADLINKALKGEFNLKSRKEEKHGSKQISKLNKPDMRRSKTIMSLLSGKKSIGSEDSDKKLSQCKRKRRMSITPSQSKLK